jgi:hypothetical protein
MISEKFSVEDIHQIRYDNFERQKNMSAEEKIKDTEKGAEEVKKLLAQIAKKSVSR